MRRILTHLNNVGFRRYAIELVKHFEKEIFGEVGGFQKYKATKKCDNANAPLRELAGKSVFETWSWYGEAKTEADQKNLQKNSFMKYPDDFKESIYFEMIE
jgi:hypothetical protein